MIRTADERVLQGLLPDELTKVRILSQLAAYGAQQPFLQFWEVAGKPQTAISLMDGVVYAASDRDYAGEIAVMLRMHRDVEVVHSSGYFAKRLAAIWNTQAELGAVMAPGPKLLPPPGGSEGTPPESLYPLLTEVFAGALPSYDRWYADISHRRRRTLCRARSVTDAGKIVACAMTTAECGDAAIIGGVATHPEHRGRGYATSCVLDLAADLTAAGKTVMIQCQNAYAIAIYGKAGFVETATWGTVKR